ncbi:type II toxin-antitoxin system RelE/ParE family toxin [Azospirillum sp. YIM B02556]|uniref:Type II toxin-antitoxin system RelE/ParE family toxin n=1 Tax=Azospirillum endophyticum TaxID=2800326 RepID=A0ABS1FFI2_9PROT|nr:type II toxin-antitoxin system RelE/ParE family toxin [Azospirillum endophyticum]MBK1842195.1 type II toxin-antitoxin system RelE/ParE family toxin [Azospirillum endophyticum]
MSHLLTGPAERDILEILRTTRTRFGTVQLRIYAALIDKGILMVAQDPDRPGMLPRPELGPDVRMLHLELAAGRRGAAAHCLYYTTGRLPDGTIGTIILRVLHEGMEPRRKVGRSLTGLAS